MTGTADQEARSTYLCGLLMMYMSYMHIMIIIILFCFGTQNAHLELKEHKEKN